MEKDNNFILDEYLKLNSGLFDKATKIANDINDIGGASVEFEHISQTGFNNDKKKSNGKMYVFDVKSGINIIDKMAEKFTGTDIVER